jgi:GTP-binding protein
MVDDVILLVGAAEGAMPRTVTGKALLGLHLSSSQIDRSDARAQEDARRGVRLFVSLERLRRAARFSVLFASRAATRHRRVREGARPAVRQNRRARAGTVVTDSPFKFLVTLLARDNFLDRILTGLVFGSSFKLNMPIPRARPEGDGRDRPRRRSWRFAASNACRWAWR